LGRAGRLGLAAALLAGLVWTVLPGVARATTITVTTTADDVDVNGNCTLREAIRAANLDQAVDACPAGFGADTIVAPAGTYTLALAGTGEDAALTGDLDLAGEVTLVGAGMPDTILDGGGLDRVLHVLEEATVTLERLTVQGGDTGTLADGGPGIRVEREAQVGLTLTRVRQNTGDAAILLMAYTERLTMRNSRVVNNSARGLNLNIGSTALIANSTISGNAGTGYGGGIYNEGGADVTVVNSTISGNSATFDGGGLSNAGDAWLYNVTVTNNTAGDDAGGIFITLGTPTLTARNTIVAGNFDSGGTPDCAGPLTSQGYNLIGDTAGCTLQGDETGNVYGSGANLGPLQNNGGATFTHALLAGSPAIDAGDPAGCADGDGTPLGTDQRGWARNGRCDMGSFEYDSPGTPTPTATATATATPTGTPPGPGAVINVTTTADDVDANGNCTLREAVRAANLNQPVDACPAGSAADTIQVPAGVYTLTIAGTNEDAALTGDLDVTEALTLAGAGRDETIVDGGGLDRVFEIHQTTAQFFSLAITGGTAPTGGGVNAAQSTVALVNTRVGGNAASDNGGGVYALGGGVSLSDSRVDHNTAPEGGGVEQEGGTLSLEQTRVDHNSGGGLRASGALTVTYSVIEANSTTDVGGGIEARGPLDVSFSRVTGNSADWDGGGIYRYGDGASSVAHSEISGNTSGDDGGGVYSNEGLLVLTNSTVSGNQADGHAGGAGNHQDGSLYLYNVTLTGNTADADGDGDGDGGGLHVDGSRLFIAANSLIAGNADGSISGDQQPDCSATTYALRIQGNNLIEDTTGCGLEGDETGNVYGQDAGLGPLQNNGGPTLTHALLAGSPAIDAGNEAGCAGAGGAAVTDDQRRFGRPADGDGDGAARCDIGAYELGGAAPTPTATPTASATATPTATATPPTPGEPGAYRIFVPLVLH
jgi:CSLREA domain-containing protein